jgi:hypothetical protein
MPEIAVNPALTPIFAQKTAVAVFWVLNFDSTLI